MVIAQLMRRGRGLGEHGKESPFYQMQLASLVVCSNFRKTLRR
jgi:hypothetical protein